MRHNRVNNGILKTSNLISFNSKIQTLKQDYLHDKTPSAALFTELWKVPLADLLLHNSIG